MKNDDVTYQCKTVDQEAAMVADLDAQAMQAKAASLESMAEDTLERIAEFFGKAVNTKAFCGLSVEETYDAHGNVCSITLTACELVGGEPMRRVAAKAH